jgi:hypothetical protein
VSQFEYIAVLVSVVTGLGVVHLLSGVARFIGTKGRWSPYWVHLLWTWNVFHYLIFFWWFVWRWSAITEWRLVLYLFILLYAVVLYLLCAVLFPPGEEQTDFRVVYFQNRGSFFGLWVLLIVIDVVDTKIKEHYGLSGFGALDILTWITLIAGSLVAARSRSHRVHAIWGVAFAVIMSVFEYVNFGALRAD